MSTVIFGAETPVYVWKDWLIIEVYNSKDSAAYVNVPLNPDVLKIKCKGVYTPLVHFKLKVMEFLNFTLFIGK